MQSSPCNGSEQSLCRSQRWVRHWLQTTERSLSLRLCLASWRRPSYIYPALQLPLRHNKYSAPEHDLSDQFTFRPTGSTTAVMVLLFYIFYYLLTTTRLFESLCLTLVKPSTLWSMSLCYSNSCGSIFRIKCTAGSTISFKVTHFVQSSRASYQISLKYLLRSCSTHSWTHAAALSNVECYPC